MEIIRRKTDYCLRALMALAESAGPQRAEDLAEREGVPTAFLHKALADLARAGFLVGQRGPTGGFTLARPAKKVSVLEVVEALQGPVAVSDCVTGDRACDRARHCPARVIWEEAQRSLEATLRGMTLADLVARGRPAARRRKAS